MNKIVLFGSLALSSLCPLGTTCNDNQDYDNYQGRGCARGPHDGRGYGPRDGRGGRCDGRGLGSARGPRDGRGNGPRDGRGGRCDGRNS